MQIIEMLYSRLSEADINAVAADAGGDRKEILKLATHRIPESRQRTGLSAALPPENIPMLGRDTVLSRERLIWTSDARVDRSCVFLFPHFLNRTGSVSIP